MELICIVLLCMSALAVNTDAAITPIESSSKWTPPQFCRERQCPVFKTLFSTESYEVRQYEPAKWVTAVGSSTEYKNASRQAFWNLYSYIKGNNDKGEKIEMTVPVISKVIFADIGPKEDNSSLVSVTKSFFLPTDSAIDAPVPIDPTMFIEDSPRMIVFVKVFEGKARFPEYQSQVEKLQRDIGDTSMYNTDFFYKAGYHRPSKSNRHNEVWLIGKFMPSVKKLADTDTETDLNVVSQ